MAIFISPESAPTDNDFPPYKLNIQQKIIAVLLLNCFIFYHDKIMIYIIIIVNYVKYKISLYKLE
jgi:hypothetical protein